MDDVEILKWGNLLSVLGDSRISARTKKGVVRTSPKEFIFGVQEVLYNLQVIFLSFCVILVSEIKIFWSLEKQNRSQSPTETRNLATSQFAAQIGSKRPHQR